MNSTVSTILAERHGINGRPGSKVECPFCGHRTFSIKGDDTIGKCFHPSCLRVITSNGRDPQHESGLHRALWTIAHATHRALLELADQPGLHAYRYCVEMRGIHPRVIVDAPIGVAPSGYDFKAAFAPEIEALEAAVRTEEAARPQRGRPRKGAEPHAQERLASLIDARDKLTALSARLPGWLMFFYTDAASRIVAIRFRQPYSKVFAMFKPTSVGGAFGHGVFAPDGSVASLAGGEPLLVVEGEFNWLQLQSLCARVAESKGHAPEDGYIFACAVGGVQNADPVTLRHLCRSPIVCYDNDGDDAGAALVDTLRQHMTITTFTTPGTDTDLDSYLRKLGSCPSVSWDALRALVATRKTLTRPYEAVKAEIDVLRTAEGALKRFQVHRLASEIVTDDLKDRGTFYNDGARGFIFQREDRRLIAIEADDVALELLLGRYGLAPNEEIFRHVRESMRLDALEHGTKTVVYVYSHYDAVSHTLYVSDLDRGIYRIRSDRTEHVDVGTDGVLFLHNPHHKPFKIGEMNASQSALDDLIFGPARFKQGALAPDEQRLVLMIWLYSIFFPELFPTRAILALIGERGSGKTSLLRRIGRLLYGPYFDVMDLSDDPKDFDAAITNSQFVAVDNADKVVPWLEDKLAVAATGGHIRKRDLFTTNRLVEYPIVAFIAITSRTPYFRREDVADRTLILQVPRLEQFVPEADLLAELDSRRDELMTEVLAHLQEMVSALRNQEGRSYSTTFRMADFANFALKLAHGLGFAQAMEQVLQRMANEQTEFALEGEQIVEFLEAWLAEDGGKNAGRPVTTAELHRDFERLAPSLGVELKLKGAQSVAQTIRHKGSALGELFDIMEHKGSGRARRLSFRLRQLPAKEAAGTVQEEPAHAS